MKVNSLQCVRKLNTSEFSVKSHELLLRWRIQSEHGSNELWLELLYDYTLKILTERPAWGRVPAPHLTAQPPGPVLFDTVGELDDIMRHIYHICRNSEYTG